MRGRWGPCRSDDWETLSVTLPRLEATPGSPRLIRGCSFRGSMSTVKPPVTMKYLADVAGVNPGLVRKYVTILRSLGEDYSTPGGDTR